MDLVYAHTHTLYHIKSPHIISYHFRFHDVTLYDIERYDMISYEILDDILKYQKILTIMKLYYITLNQIKLYTPTWYGMISY